MCGISGIYNFHKKEVGFELINTMNNTLIHRGPDHGAVKLFSHTALGHRRLSIIDVSDAANQPMTSDDERFTIVFNGEVYNFIEIKQQLKKAGANFHTNSDTEVVLKAYQIWGVEALKKFNGMFAFAIYDKHKDELIIARDQFGIKPLYYYLNNDMLLFASEMKAIMQHPDVSLLISKQGLVEYMWFGNPMGNNTIYKQISELSAGSYLILKKNNIEIKSYFKLSEINEVKITEEEAIEQIKYLLNESVKRHLISDVPVGIFLSGGVDSSAITALASKYYSGDLKTYSVGFDFAKGPNELNLAASVAKMFGTNHHEIQIKGENTINVIEALLEAHDEPFGDAANIPLYLLTQKLKGTIKVVLQGDGGDEFFGGYRRYNAMSDLKKWKLLKWLPSMIAFSGTNNNKFLRAQRFLNAINQRNPAIRNALLLTSESKFFNITGLFNKEFRDELNLINPFDRYLQVYNTFPENIDNLQAIFYNDTQTILKDTYFEKVDKSTMANSLEVRVPFLDKNLAEFVMSIPSAIKVKKGSQKYLLKKALKGVVPDEILYGKKTGFSVPFGYWLRTSLADYFVDQVSTSIVCMYLDKTIIMKLFNLHKFGKGNNSFLLWKILMFAVWLNKKQNRLMSIK